MKDIYLDPGELSSRTLRNAERSVEDAVRELNKLDSYGALANARYFCDGYNHPLFSGSSINMADEAISTANTLLEQIHSCQKILDTGPDALEEIDRDYKGQFREWEHSNNKHNLFGILGLGAGAAPVIGIYSLGLLIGKLFEHHDKKTTHEVPINVEQKEYNCPPPTYVHENSSPYFPMNRAHRATPIKESHSAGYRSQEAYNEVIDSFDVEHNPRYQISGENTYCNIYAWDVTSAMGCEIPHWINSKGEPMEPGAPGAYELNADDTKRWLNEHGPDYGWHECSSEDAINHANSGEPAVAIGTGHVAMVAPQRSGETGVQISQAGGKNYSHTSINWGWSQGKQTQVKYYYHD